MISHLSLILLILQVSLFYFPYHSPQQPSHNPATHVYFLKKHLNICNLSSVSFTLLYWHLNILINFGFNFKKYEYPQLLQLCSPLPPTLLNGEGNGNPLQYSCLENPMDRGTWWAMVLEVAES